MCRRTCEGAERRSDQWLSFRRADELAVRCSRDLFNRLTESPISFFDQSDQFRRRKKVADEMRPGLIWMPIPHSMLGTIVQSPDFARTHVISVACAQHPHVVICLNRHMDSQDLWKIPTPVHMKGD